MRADCGLRANKVATSRRANDGFVLVTSLLILMVLAGLGAGAFFLTTMNLRIAENTSTSTVAQYSAYEGVDVALIALARAFRDSNGLAWPTEAELRDQLPDADGYRLDRLEFETVPVGEMPLEGTVTIRGLGGRGAEYVSSARFVAQRTPNPIPPGASSEFGVGFVTPKGIRINGATTFEISLWAGDYITASATNVLSGSARSARAGWVNAIVGGTEAECKISEDSGVECLSGQQPPDPDPFVFEDGRMELWDERGQECDVTYSSNTSINASTLPAKHTVCLTGSATLNLSGTATGLYVIGTSTTTVNLSASSVPVSGDPDADEEDQVGLKIASGTIALDRGTDFELSGVNTLYAVNTLNLVNVRSTITGASPSIFMATEGNVDFGANTGKGGKKGDGTLNAVILANGSVCKFGSGGLNFSGGIVALGQTPSTRPQCGSHAIYWNGGGGGLITDNTNPNIPTGGDDAGTEFEAAGIRVLAKRP